MSTADPDSSRRDIARSLIVASGIFLLVLGLGFNEFIVAALRDSALEARAIERIRIAQSVFLLLGALFVVLAATAARSGTVARVFSTPLAPQLLLAIIVTLLPAVVLELVLRPFSPVPIERTGLYERDPDLGWRLKPGFVGRDIGGGSVRINSRGMRGPEVAQEKPEGVTRILYLGDSVTFGWLLESEDTFPVLAEQRLEARLQIDVETLNTGVSGYSPWQEYHVLVNDGFALSPDLVVLSFVLNDVTEKFGLSRFGGSGEGTQLSQAATSSLDWFTARSALFHGAKQLGARLRFGPDVQAGARAAEELAVGDLVTQPGDERVAEAWDLTLENMGRIVEACRERDIPVVIAVFPFTFQFNRVAGIDRPQRIVKRFAQEEGVPVLDLLPGLIRRLRGERKLPRDYFFDADHPNPDGSRAVADLMADFLIEENLVVARHSAGATP